MKTKSLWLSPCQYKPPASRRQSSVGILRDREASRTERWQPTVVRRTILTALMPPAVAAAVLAADRPRLVRDHLYVRYNGPAPDHARNRASAARWNIR